MSVNQDTTPRTHPAANSTPDPFPWSQVMAFGLGILRLPPDAFWAMTPRELAAAMGHVDRNQIVTSRRWLDEAASRYPDVATDAKETSDG